MLSRVYLAFREVIDSGIDPSFAHRQLAELIVLKREIAFSGI
jgi:hypothetical protein